jgi:hypothetical protein
MIKIKGWKGYLFVDNSTDINKQKGATIWQVSNHANERINEQCGLNKKSAERLSKLALENGILHHDTVGSLNRYLTKLFFYNQLLN